MKKAPMKEEAVFWLLGGSGVVLAIYVSMVTSYTD